MLETQTQIVFIDGAEGSGKSTLIRTIEREYELEHVKFPIHKNETELEHVIKNMFYDNKFKSFGNQTKKYLFVAQSIDLFLHYIKPQIENNVRLVVCDRGLLSNLIYQVIDVCNPVRNKVLEQNNIKDFIRMWEQLLSGIYNTTTPFSNIHHVVLHGRTDMLMNRIHTRSENDTNNINKENLLRVGIINSGYLELRNSANYYDFLNQYTMIDTTKETPEEVFSIVRGLLDNILHITV